MDEHPRLQVRITNICLNVPLTMFHRQIFMATFRDDTLKLKKKVKF